VQGDRPSERPGNPPPRVSEDKPRLDRSRYPWQFTIQNRFELDRLLGFGITTNSKDELVGVGVSPDYWTFDLATCQQIAFAWQGLCQRLEDEQERRREQQDKQE
jgi:hypothetical protein